MGFECLVLFIVCYVGMAVLRVFVIEFFGILLFRLF